MVEQHCSVDQRKFRAQTSTHYWIRQIIARNAYWAITGSEKYWKYWKKKAIQISSCCKGDLLDQENKLERSGLTPYFDHWSYVPIKQRKNISVCWIYYKSLLPNLSWLAILWNQIFSLFYRWEGMVYIFFWSDVEAWSRGYIHTWPSDTGEKSWWVTDVVLSNFSSWLQQFHRIQQPGVSYNRIPRRSFSKYSVGVGSCIHTPQYKGCCNLLTW